jgi:hypothetical protein
MSESDANKVSQEDAIRELFEKRMKQEQDLFEKYNKPGVTTQPRPIDPTGVLQSVPDMCPHGVPLARSCPKCDVITENDIQSSIPLN